MTNGPRKRLALFFDGTWQQPQHHSNVRRLHLMLAEQGQDGIPQRAFYRPGVGTRWYDRSMRRNITLAFLATLSLSACAHAPPPIGRGGPRLAADVTPWFDTRVKQRFPVGSDDGSLRAELQKEAFVIKQAGDQASRYPFTATHQANEGVCRAWWTIRWASEQGKVTDIAAEWGQTCL
jgi:hypothetical protein